MTTEQDLFLSQWMGNDSPIGGLSRDQKKFYFDAHMVQTKSEARARLESLIQLTLTTENDRAVAERAARFHLGYSFGYLEPEERDRLERLYGVEHPIFGSIERCGVTPWTRAFQIGQESGERLRKLGLIK